MYAALPVTGSRKVLMVERVATGWWPLIYAHESQSQNRKDATYPHHNHGASQLSEVTQVSSDRSTVSE
jgi:hypothetical protein